MMYSAIFISLLLVGCALARTQVEYEESFVSWVKHYNKAYSRDEFQQRFETFKANLDYVTSWNSENHGFTLATNQFADLTNEEFNRMYLGLKQNTDKPRNFAEISVADIPDSVDWRTKGAVTHVKDQGQCGSCWSFSTTGSIEGAWQIANHTLVALSEQNLCDCSSKYGNAGCSGGLMDDAFQYVIDNKGIDTEASYPYTAVDATVCKFSKNDIGATISAFKDVPSKNETSLTNLIATQGPISVAIDASHNSFQLYSSGVYYEAKCSADQLDHGVLAVGYGTDATKGDYYIVKNSWGVSWGQEGYIWMTRNNKNNCGIATMASFPIV